MFENISTDICIDDFTPDKLRKCTLSELHKKHKQVSNRLSMLMFIDSGRGTKGKPNYYREVLDKKLWGVWLQAERNITKMSARKVRDM
jgi:hypothetical protein